MDYLPCLVGGMSNRMGTLEERGRRISSAGLNGNSNSHFGCQQMMLGELWCVELETLPKLGGCGMVRASA